MRVHVCALFLVFVLQAQSTTLDTSALSDLFFLTGGKFTDLRFIFRGWRWKVLLGFRRLDGYRILILVFGMVSIVRMASPTSVSVKSASTSHLKHHPALKNNNLTGTIPDSISRLPIRYLNFYQNSITAFAVTSTLTTLLGLELDLNNLNSFHLPNAPNLESLVISNNPMTSFSITSAPILENLFLQGTLLGPSLPPQFCQTPATIINLNLGSIGLTSLPSCMSQFTSLETLNIENNPLGDDTQLSFLSNMPNLQVLKMGGTRFDHFPLVISTLPKLNDLDVSHGIMSGPVPYALNQLNFKNIGNPFLFIQNWQWIQIYLIIISPGALRTQLSRPRCKHTISIIILSRAFPLFRFGRAHLTNMLIRAT